jgi:phospholipid/cholesterol/gamma-HCH transport system ATP-binding protein
VALIEVKDVRTRFGDKKVLRGIDLSVERQELVSIIGESGTGKSLLLKHLVGLVPVTEGTIEFDGQDVTRLKERDWIPIRRRIGIVFQGAALFDSLTIFDNVAYGLREQHILPEAEIPRRVAESLEQVSLPGVEQMRPGDLSGGMRKRVSLARAIALRPEVILFDGPTEGLDPINVTRVNRLIDSLRKALGITVVVVTHQMESAFEVSDRVALLEHGRFELIGSPRELEARGDPRLRAYIRAAHAARGR